MNRNNELLVRALFVLGAMFVGTMFCFKLLADYTGLPFWELASLSNARTLLLGPAALGVVLVIERYRVPLPFRIENTWPLIAGLFWISIHFIFTLKAEAVTDTDQMFDLPWYTETWFGVLGFVIIVGGGYVIRKRRNDLIFK